VNHALTLPGIGDLVDGRFRIDRKLGEGGTSQVYEVSHVITDKKFAIKWLLPELALEDAAVDRFIHEARVGGKFAHPHAVQVYDICKASDSFYMLMELLQGESLQTRLEREVQLSVQEACSIVLTCADVLCAAHRAGIIHRDLKPANIFLSKEGDNPEVTKLLDFGISTFCSDLQSMSLTATPRGSVIGTPLYMSPEQMLGEPVDRRADIYALGAVLYELVSGQPPFQADNYGELVVRVTVEASPTPLEQLAPVDKQFCAVVARAMARRPHDRYSSVEELIFALRPFAAPLDTSTVRTIVPPQPTQQVQPTPAAAVAAFPQLYPPQSYPPIEIVSPPPRTTTPGVGRRALWTGALGIATALLATAGAHWLERSHDAASAHVIAAHGAQPERPPANPQQAHALAVAPGGSVPADSWEQHPAGPEVLTSVPTTPSPRAAGPAGKSARRSEVRAPQVQPVQAVQTENKAPGPAAREAKTTNTARSAARADKATAATSPARTAEAERAARREPEAERVARRESSDDAVPGAHVQLKRADFRGVSAPANAPPPKASVSRADF
jgi:serine/threonine protein kinase